MARTDADFNLSTSGFRESVMEAVEFGFMIKTERGGRSIGISVILIAIGKFLRNAGEQGSFCL